ncbi:MAG: dTDP-4-dehydrorhamnose reductase [Alistipes sp.]|nr:dTDP-4-dehydrorhamnose reductase [Alistipes sp.]
MTILVTGGNGQLGCALRLASAESQHRYIFTDIEELDITSATAIEEFFHCEKVDIVVNCAAYTAVDLAEENEAKADEINHKAVALLADACRRHNATLIHISTDYIFSGKADTPYREEESPAPINAYGRTKLAGERAIAESGCRSIVIRTSWLYSEYGKNFVKTMLSLMASRSEVRVVADQMGTPTYAGDLARAITYIIDSGQSERLGVYHYSNMGECSWYEFAVEIARLSGIDCIVTPCTTADYPTTATRPQYSVLDKRKSIATFGLTIPEWRESLRHCIENLSK